ncbi:caspase-8-like [Gracilinanus agilis]|uniref:caspase-8-like n=1 Tax=Gracilinanus agilis TaxID=191870 RepID=UPI001CFC93A7|nr:caspase-8-like [Gracilinanus agilis]
MEETLLKINNELTRSDLEKLKFLSSDILPLGNRENIQEPLALFQALQRRQLLDNYSILEELLFLIGRKDILTNQLNVRKEEVERKLQHSDSLKVSPYRKLLFNIAENMTDDYLESSKFLLQKTLPLSKLEDIKTPLKLFTEMEKNGNIHRNDLEILKEILQNMNAESLLQLIKNYEAKTKDLPESAATAQLESRLGDLRLQSGIAGQAASPLNVPEESEMKTLPQSMSPYKMEHVPHGYVVIINNKDFRDPTDVRLGTEKDVDALRKVFTWLQFEVKLHKNLDASQLHEVMKYYSKKDYTDQDSFICCILSHGKKGAVLGTDSQPVAIKKLLSYFTTKECLTLKDKPKLFFIQACQIEKTDSPPEMDVEFELEADAIVSNPAHEWSDMFIGMSTVEDFPAQRNIYLGSPYIQNLCQELEAHCPQKKELLEIMTNVNQKVGNSIQMPEFRSTLRGPFIFQVPEESQKTPNGH